MPLWKWFWIIKLLVLLTTSFSSQSKQQNRHRGFSASFVSQFFIRECIYFSRVISFSLLKLKWNWSVENSFEKASVSHSSSFVWIWSSAGSTTWIFIWTIYYIMHYSRMSISYTLLILFGIIITLYVLINTSFILHITNINVTISQEIP